MTKHVLATGFSAVSSSTGTAAPGDAIPFFPAAAAGARTTARHKRAERRRFEPLGQRAPTTPTASDQRSVAPGSRPHAVAAGSPDRVLARRRSAALIFVSGDNGNYFSFLVPESDTDPANMRYRKSEPVAVGADVGRAAFGDADGDGRLDLFVPAYDRGQVLRYEFVAV